jgi:formylglycine-generating enzyme required for sulfatase activity
MGVFLVTQEQYQQVMGVNPSYYKDQPANPVENVSWDDAMEFCKKLSAKTGKKVTLPTEAQWEYACRAGTTTAYYTGDELRKGQANAAISSKPGIWDKPMEWVRKFFPAKAKTVETTPVGSFPSNGFGLYDMHGNIWEWCADWYGEDYYAKSPKTDPQGPNTGDRRVLRGGSWGVSPWDCRSAYRGWYAPDYRGRSLGFRVAVSPGLD